jgi:hypothetical protein
MNQCGIREIIRLIMVALGKSFYQDGITEIIP